jgi:hypothetical protein
MRKKIKDANIGAKNHITQEEQGVEKGDRILLSSIKEVGVQKGTDNYALSTK